MGKLKSGPIQCQSCANLYELMEPLKSSVTRKRLLLGVALGVLVSASTIVTVCQLHRSRTGILHEELVDILKEIRLTEGRFTGGFRYARIRANISLSRSDLNRLRRLRQKVAEKSSTIRDRAIIAFIDGKLDLALELLRNAIKDAPNNADLLNDIAALYLCRRDSLQPKARDLVRGLSAASKAIELDPNLAPAFFNQAVILQRLNLTRDSEAAFRSYLGLDNRSSWAKEAQLRLATLRRSSSVLASEDAAQELKKAAASGDQAQVKTAVARFPQFARELGGTVLGEWGKHEIDKHTTAAQRDVHIVTELGTALAQFNGDYMLLDAAHQIEASMTNIKQRKALARGHNEFKVGQQEYDEFRIASASKHLHEARRLLAAGESPFAKWAEFYVQACRYQEGQYHSALTDLLLLDRTVSARRYPTLKAKILWVMGLLSYIEMKPNLALDFYSSSLLLFQAAKEAANAGAVHELLSEVYDLLGEPDRAWVHLDSALRASSALTDSKRLQAIFQHAALMCLREGELISAIHFQSEIINRLEQFHKPEPLAVALAVRAKINYEAARHFESVRDIAKARVLAEQIPDTGVRAVVLGDMNLLAGELNTHQAPQMALDELDRALEEYTISGYRRYLPRLYLARSRAHLSNHQLLLGKADAWGGIREVERQQKSLPTTDLRASFLDTMEEVFDNALHIELATGGTVSSSFELCERGRSRALAELLHGSRSVKGTISIYDVQKALLPTAALLEYKILPDRILIWVVNRDSIRLTSWRLNKRDLLSWVERLCASLEVHQEFDRSASTMLYRALISPVEQFLIDRTAVVIVPDKFLVAVPFAVLTSPKTSKYLIEKFAILMAPSARIFVESLNRYRVLATKPIGRVLTVGDPTFDRRDFPDLPALKFSELEAMKVGANYKRAHVLLGQHATRNAVLRDLKRADIVHIAGHSIVDREAPMFSRIILAPSVSARDRGVIFAYEIYKQRLRARLVVLSACSTAAGGGDRLEGMESLIRPFLAAGVPVVIGSLQRTSDEAGAEFLTRFHRRLSAGEGILESFREAQIELIRSKDRSLASPKAWGIFLISGGAEPAQTSL